MTSGAGWPAGSTHRRPGPQATSAIDAISVTVTDVLFFTGLWPQF